MSNIFLPLLRMYLSPFAIRDVISFLPGNPKQLHQPNCFHCNPVYCSVIKKISLSRLNSTKKMKKRKKNGENRNPNAERSVTKVRLFLVLQSNPTNVIAKCFNWAKNETQERQKKRKKSESILHNTNKIEFQTASKRALFIFEFITQLGGMRMNVAGKMENGVKQWRSENAQQE